MLWFQSNPRQEGRICPVLQRRLEIIHPLWTSALPVGWGGFLGANVDMEKEHAVSPLALSVPVWSPIFRAERSTFPAAQPPLLFSASFYTANALSSLLGCIQPQPSLAFTFPFWSRLSLVCRREWSFSWSSPVTIILKNSSERYSHSLPLFLSCKLQMTSPFKAHSFLKSKISIAGFLVHLIVFYLSTWWLITDKLLSLSWVGTWFFFLTPRFCL